MRRISPFGIVLGATALVVVSSAGLAHDAPDQRPTKSVFASGLNNPRGLKFGPDGNLYVAEGGLGGSQAPPDDPDCVVPPPVGPYAGSATGSRISRIDRHGQRTTVVDGLPSSQTSPALGNLVSGVADIAFIGRTMYAILAGAGCSHGVPSVPNSILRIHKDGTWKVIADLGAYQRAHPVANPEPDDFEPDGTWYSMTSLFGFLYALEPNHGELVRVTTEGRIHRVVDISASQGHIVPTALVHRGVFFVGNLGTFPQDAGSSKILAVFPDGHVAELASGFNLVTGLAIDRRNRLYVLETSAPPAPAPGTGRIVRVDFNGKHTVIADGLFFPTAMTFGPDGNLYVSNVGFGPPPVGMGEILKFDFGH
jgi:hypothetical protein